MPNDILRFGLVGAGEIAVQTAAAITAVPHATITGVMDVREDLARDLAEQYDGLWTTDVSDLLARDDVDVVYIAVPHHLHLYYAERAAAAGKHILVEKPMGVSVAEADRILEAAREAGVYCSVPFVMRYVPANRKAWELVRSGAIGEITGVSMTMRADKPASYWRSGYSGRAETDWRMRKATAGGGVLITNMVHNLDLIRWISGLEVTRVYAEAGTFWADVEVEDLIVVTLRYENGAIGVIEAGASIPGGQGPAREWGDRLYGRQGQIVLPNPWSGGPLLLYTTEAGRWQEIPCEPPGDTRAALIEEFAQAVLAGKPPPIPGEDARAVLAICVAAYQAAETGKAVELS